MENPNQRKRHRSDDDGNDDNENNNKNNNNERTHHHKSLESLSCLFRQHAELMKSQSDALFHMCGMSTKISSRNIRSSIDVDDDDDDDHNDLNNNNNNNSSSSISRSNSNSNDSVISYSSSSSSSSSISMTSRTIRIQPSKSELISNIEKLFYQKVIIEQTINPNQCTVKEFRILVEEEMKLVCELSIAKKKILKECLMDLITRYYNNGDFVDNTTKTLSCI